MFNNGDKLLLASFRKCSKIMFCAKKNYYLGDVLNHEKILGVTLDKAPTYRD
jgi:hypothetical protein